MSTYFLFAGDDYYPLGGARDFIAASPTVDEAKAAYAGQNWAHIADADMKIVLIYNTGVQTRDGHVLRTAGWKTHEEIEERERAVDAWHEEGWENMPPLEKQRRIKGVSLQREGEG